MHVQFLAPKRLWILETRRTALALGLTPEGLLVQTYWGPKLPLPEDYPEARETEPWSSFDSSAERSLEIFPAWGGVRFKECCLKAEFFDKCRNTLLAYVNHSIVGQVLRIELRDPSYPLGVHISFEALEDCDLFCVTSSLENHGQEPILLEQALTAALYPPQAKDYRLTHLTGRWVGEFSLRQETLPWGKTILESRRGFTSHHASPWFALDSDGRATENEGRVYFGALSYSGSWKIAFERNTFNRVAVLAGINDFDFRWTLEGGHRFELPSLVFGFAEAGFGQASRQLHEYELRHALHAEDRGPRSLLYNSWEATYFDVNEAGQTALAEVAAELGVELFVMDDGWFGARNSDSAGLGDWQTNPQKFPHGLKPLIEKVNGLGMKFGLWIEPEMVNPDSDLYRTHPDWVYHFPSRPRSEMRNQLVLNLARSDVRDYVLTTVDKLLSENNINFIKWDLNRSVAEPGWAGAPEGKEREVWVRHTEALYDIICELKKRHPRVLFQSCSGGGGRVDLGILRGFGQVWPSDNTDAFDRLLIQEGFSYAFCAKIMESWVTEEENWLNKRRLPLRYRFHVAMMGNLGLGADITKWNASEKAEATELIAIYKSIRPIIHEGTLHRILSPRDGNLAAVLYLSRDERQAVLFLFSHGRRMGTPWPRIPVRGLPLHTQYRRVDSGAVASGIAWSELGVAVELEGEFASALIRFEAVS